MKILDYIVTLLFWLFTGYFWTCHIIFDFPLWYVLFFTVITMMQSVSAYFDMTEDNSEFQKDSVVFSKEELEDKIILTDDEYHNSYKEGYVDGYDKGRESCSKELKDVAKYLLEESQPKLSENQRIIDMNENPCLSCPVPEEIQNDVDCSTICGSVRAGIDWQMQCRVLVKENRQLKKELKNLSGLIKSDVSEEVKYDRGTDEIADS